MALSHDQGPSVLSALETIDKPIYSSHYAPETISQDTPKGRPVPVARISTLPPLPTLPYAGPSTGPQRYLFVAVRRGHNKGVYTSWPEAQRQIADHPSPVFKTFSTRFAAEAFVLGWNGSGRHCLPASSPKPLREHLAMTFPSAVSAQPPSTSTRTPYHIKMLSSSPPVESTWTTSIVGGDFAPGYLNASASRTSTYRHSLVKVSSPLRSQVDGEAADAPSIRPADAPSIRPSIRKATSMIGIGGLLSPPASPEDPLGHVHPPPVQTLPSRPQSLRAKSECGSTGSHKQFPAVDMGLGLLSPPNSPPSAPVKRPSMASLRSSQSYSGLWADSKPVTSSSLSRSPLPSPSIIEADTPTSNAPKFSRSGLKKSGVIMPAAAPRTNSSTSSLTLNRGSSRSSLPPSPSMTSLNSVSSRKGSGSRPVSTRTDSQDRLASLAETSRRELKLNEEGLLALQSLSPPRPAFMVRRSGSNSSLSSLTSISSASSSLVQPGSIPEDEEWDMGRRASSGLGVHVADEVVISCTKSDADADGSVESSSMKSGAGGKSGKKKGGLFRRLGQALKLEKKQPAAGAAGRRPSA